MEMRTSAHPAAPLGKGQHLGLPQSHVKEIHLAATFLTGAGVTCMPGSRGVAKHPARSFVLPCPSSVLPSHDSIPNASGRRMAPCHTGEDIMVP